MTEEIKIGKKDVVACNYWKACDYYKQLKRLEEKYDTLTNKFFNSETDKTRLEQENERLKEENKQLEDFVKSSGEIDHINHEYTYKLKKVLQEIKEIAEQRNYLNYGEALDDILDLITKAESEG